ncbi:hypothetical protein [Metabacillus fastidiosus]|uniref:DUF4240 domain-containing protein n=1 Tax=Metabacillus fastidiosus TaxID=1458 RepID=A0ABU6NV90_9BACI|nr:hypothetical protein [Metabacillus fastidiosus]MED4400277.1 hypothetical protein [Metabacillus fastidiosus]
MDLDKFWTEMDQYGEVSIVGEDVFELMKVLIYSSAEKFGDIREFVEKVDRKTIELAIDEIQYIPTMEAGDEEQEPHERYHLHANEFREVYQLRFFQSKLWHDAKPKKKRFF